MRGVRLVVKKTSRNQDMNSLDEQVAGQPTAESTVGVLDAALLPGRIGITEPRRHVEH